MTPLLGESLPTDELGKKAGNLDVLVRAGFAVPPGFTVLDGEAPDAELLAARIAQIGGFPVAVRSSGVLEDLAGASFAGQYETFLHVASLDELQHRLAECRASARSERVLAYLADRGLPAERARLAVLVQRMIDPRIAGVGFSVHPVTGREEEGLVEAVAGVGESLVSGTASPSSYTIRLRDGAIVDARMDDPAATLDAPGGLALADLLVRVQAWFGRPMDIEWAQDHEGRLWLLQARPITTISWRNDLGEWSTANLREGGIASRVCTPFVERLIGDVFGRSMQSYLASVSLMDEAEPVVWMRLVYGRPYWNTGRLKAAMTALPGFDEANFDEGLGIRRDYGAAGPRRTGWGVATVLRAIPTAWAVWRWYDRTLELLEGHADRFAQRAKELLARVPHTDDELGALLRDTFAFFRWSETVYLTLGYTNNSAHRELVETVAQIDAHSGARTDATALMGGLDGVSHVELQRAFEALLPAARAGFDTDTWRDARAAFLAVHGYHGDVELDPSEPRWSERPEAVDLRVGAMLASAARAGHDEAGAAAFSRTRDEVLARAAGLGLRGWFFSRRFRFRLERMRTFLRHKEATRELSARSYGVVRAAVLRAADRLVATGELTCRDDVFLFTPDELAARFTDGAPFQAEELAWRRAQHAGWRDFEPAGELGSGVPLALEAGAGDLRGVGCSPGVVEGTVRVVHQLAELADVQDGDILVTRFTDPNWTPALARVRGIVTEVGGVLSHAAVIGREYGIPAVLNVAGATTTLRTGQRVRVDGGAGTVTLLGDA